MGSKTLVGGKRVGQTRNSRRKTEYAQQAAQAASKRGSGVVQEGVVAKSGVRGGRTNHQAGTALKNPGNAGRVHGQQKFNKEARRAEANARKADYDNLSPAQKLSNLDKLFGAGKGAVRERARIAKRLAEAFEAAAAQAAASQSKKAKQASK